MIVILTALAVFPCISSSDAGDVKPKLSPDGSWTRYYVVQKQDSGREIIFRLTIRSVGRVRKDGRWHRWIEYEAKYREIGRPYIHKFLISEKALIGSEKPMEHVVKYLYRDAEGLVTAGDTAFARHFGMPFLFLPGTLKKTKTVKESRTVDYQKGRLTISTARSGVYSWSWQAQTIKQFRTIETRYKVWLHKDVPFGFAYAEMKWTYKKDGRPAHSATFEFSFEETGTGAKPAFTESDVGSIVKPRSK